MTSGWRVRELRLREFDQPNRPAPEQRPSGA
jgi:hypothetical protein